MSSRTLLVICSALLGLGCTLDKVAIPIGMPQLVLHGLLTNKDSIQTLLIERTLTGAYTVPVYISDNILTSAVNDVDPSEPVLSDGGDPVRGAIAILTSPAGKADTTREYSTYSPQGHGAGVYRFTIKPANLVPGGRYRLKIATKEGAVATAEMVVPATTPIPAIQTVDFNRDSDTLSLSWPAVAGARSYQVDIDSPYEHWSTFTDSASLKLPGTLRNLDSDNLSRVFMPGFRQTVTVAAVDTNLYDYYRTTSGFTGSGIISRVKGGLGMFGAYMIMSRRLLNVTAPIARPIEGAYGLVALPTTGSYGGAADAQSLALYVESPAIRADQPTALSGQTRNTLNAPGAILGELSGSRVKIVFLFSQKLTDTLDIFTGDVRGDTLDGRFRKGALAKYMKKH